MSDPFQNELKEKKDDRMSTPDNPTSGGNRYYDEFGQGHSTRDTIAPGSAGTHKIIRTGGGGGTVRKPTKTKKKPKKEEKPKPKPQELETVKAEREGRDLSKGAYSYYDKQRNRHVIVSQEQIWREQVLRGQKQVKDLPRWFGRKYPGIDKTRKKIVKIKSKNPGSELKFITGRAYDKDKTNDEPVFVITKTPKASNIVDFSKTSHDMVKYETYNVPFKSAAAQRANERMLYRKGIKQAPMSKLGSPTPSALTGKYTFSVPNPKEIKQFAPIKGGSRTTKNLLKEERIQAEKAEIQTRLSLQTAKTARDTVKNVAPLGSRGGVEFLKASPFGIAAGTTFFLTDNKATNFYMEHPGEAFKDTMTGVFAWPILATKDIGGKLRKGDYEAAIGTAAGMAATAVTFTAAGKAAGSVGTKIYRQVKPAQPKVTYYYGRQSAILETKTGNLIKAGEVLDVDTAGNVRGLQQTFTTDTVKPRFKVVGKRNTGISSTGKVRGMTELIDLEPEVKTVGVTIADGKNKFFVDTSPAPTAVKKLPGGKTIKLYNDPVKPKILMENEFNFGRDVYGTKSMELTKAKPTGIERARSKAASLITPDEPASVPELLKAEGSKTRAARLKVAGKLKPSPRISEKTGAILEEGFIFDIDVENMFSTGGGGTRATLKTDSPGLSTGGMSSQFSELQKATTKSRPMFPGLRQTTRAKTKIDYDIEQPATTPQNRMRLTERTASPQISGTSSRVLASFRVSPRVKFGTKILRGQKQSHALKQMQGLKQSQMLRQRRGLKQSHALKQMQGLKQSQMLRQKLSSRQTMKLRQRQKLSLRTKPGMKLGLMPMLGTRKRSRGPGITQGFNLFVRKGGKWIKRASNIPRGFAMKKGSKEVLGTSAASFKLEKGGLTKGMDTNFSLSKMFRKPKRGKKNNVFIEKTSFRIDSPGELKEITFKGQKTRSLLGKFGRLKL